jgi:hypothetical protein
VFGRRGRGTRVRDIDALSLSARAFDDLHRRARLGERRIVAVVPA